MDSQQTPRDTGWLCTTCLEPIPSIFISKFLRGSNTILGDFLIPIQPIHLMYRFGRVTMVFFYHINKPSNTQLISNIALSGGNITLAKHKQRTKHEEPFISTGPKLARLFFCVGKTNKKTDVRIPDPGSP